MSCVHAFCTGSKYSLVCRYLDVGSEAYKILRRMHNCCEERICQLLCISDFGIACCHRTLRGMMHPFSAHLTFTHVLQREAKLKGRKEVESKQETERGTEGSEPTQQHYYTNP
jgi:hypothetical protein